MHLFLGLFLALLSLPTLADEHARLYRAGGWLEQRAHFHAALKAAQLRYRANLPPAVYRSLVDNSNRRFQPQAMDRRALAELRRQLADPRPALQFFESPLGRKVVAAEVEATSRASLQRYAKGLPEQRVDARRRESIRRLAEALPASEAGAELSLALAGVAADSLSQMVPGLALGSGQTQRLLDSQRVRLTQRIEANLDNSLLQVYRGLSDRELDAFVEFAASPAGQAYYRAALAALRAGLAVGRSTQELERQSSL